MQGLSGNSPIPLQLSEKLIMIASLNYLHVYTSIDGAIAALSVDTRLVSKKWNKTSKNPEAFERAVLVPFECVAVTSEEVPEQFLPLVRSALNAAAVSVLVAEIEERGNMCNEIPVASFNRPRLIEAFLGADTWLSKEELEKQFGETATWNRIKSRPEFATNKQYMARVAAFKADVLKLSAKNGSWKLDDLDRILATIDPTDFETEAGAFIARRCADIKAKLEADKVDYSGL
jgi:hypothetical protein